MRLTFVALRVVVAVLLVGAIGSQLGAAVDEHAGAGGTVIVAAVTNFLSYITIQSNALAVVVLVLTAGFLLRKDIATPGWLAVVRVGDSRDLHRRAHRFRQSPRHRCHRHLTTRVTHEDPPCE